MELNEFQRAALRTWNEKTDSSGQLVNAVLGLAGESGEVAEMVKKGLFHGQPIDAAKIRKELGDILYYVAATAYCFRISLDDVAQTNIDKLLARYPNGFEPKAHDGQ